MSITSIINGHSFDSLKAYIREKAPKKDSFVSNTELAAFSTAIPIKVKGTTATTYETALVGELADYVFCLEILRFVQKNKMLIIKDFFQHIDQAYTLILNSCVSSTQENGKKHQSRYVAVKTACLMYVLGQETALEKVVEYADILNKVEHYHHVRSADAERFWETFDMPCKKCIADDVMEMVYLFRKSFFESGLIRKNSTVVLHPRFCTHTSPVGIADLYADGILYDFKATKKNGYNWRDVGQVYGYYILHKLCTKYDRDAVLAEPVPIKRVAGIGLYYSRYGDVETCDLKNCDAVLTSKETAYLAKMMDQHRRETDHTHFESMKALYAQSEWHKLYLSRCSNGSLVFTPENVDYTVGDIVYDPSHGKGEVVKFVNKDGQWHVVILFDSGKRLLGNINEVILLNWKHLEKQEMLQDASHYFL